MMTYFCVLISHKRTSLKYLYFVCAETALQAQLDAWSKFKAEYEVVSEDEWLLLGYEAKLDEGTQQLARIDW